MMKRLLIVTMLLLSWSQPSRLPAEKLVITTPNNPVLANDNLAAAAIDMVQGSSAIKCAVVMTGDDQLVLHATTDLAHQTNVAERYPERRRDDGSFQVFDFLLEEVQSLHLKHPEPNGDEQTPRPLLPSLRISSLAEVLSLLAPLEQSTGNTIRVMVEGKQAWRHRREQKQLGAAIVQHLADFKLLQKTPPPIIASYDPEFLKALDQTMPAQFRQQVLLYQFIDFNDGIEHQQREGNQWLPYDYQWLLTTFGLKLVSDYADGLGFRPEFVYNQDGQPQRPTYFENARLLGLSLLLYPVDHLLDMDQPGEIESFITKYLFSAALDGLITSHPQKIKAIIKKKTAAQSVERGPAKTPIERFLEKIKQEQTEPEAIVKP